MIAVRADLPEGLPTDALRRRHDPGALGFETSEELEGVRGPVGQERAIEALRLSARMAHPDFNVFVLGPEGYGRHRIVEEILSSERVGRPAPQDWIYVNDFETPHRPKALRLPTGTAAAFRHEMQTTVDDLANEIPALFESDEYQSQRRALEQELGSRHEAALADFAERPRRRRRDDVGPGERGDGGRAGAFPPRSHRQAERIGGHRRRAGTHRARARVVRSSPRLRQMSRRRARCDANGVAASPDHAAGGAGCRAALATRASGSATAARRSGSGALQQGDEMMDARPRTFVLALLSIALSIGAVPSARAESDPVTGRELASEHCTRCHDVSAEGRFKRHPPSFAAIAVYRSPDQIYGRIAFPPLHSSMPSVGYMLTPENIEDLVAYIVSLERR